MSLVSSANRELKMKRHENVKPDLRPDYKILELNQVTITRKLFGGNLQSDIVEIKNASRVTQSLTRSYRPQTPQTSDTNLNHEINNKTKQGKKAKLFKGRAQDVTDLIESYTNIKLQSG